MDFLSFLINGIPALGIAFSLFGILMHVFGWAHRYGWPFWITLTEAKLSGKYLRQYNYWHALFDLLLAICFFCAISITSVPFALPCLVWNWRSTSA